MTHTPCVLAHPIPGRHLDACTDTDCACGILTSEAARCANTERPLTRPLDATRRGLAMNATQGCSVPECLRPHKARGMCARHYQRDFNQRNRNRNREVRRRWLDRQPEQWHDDCRTKLLSFIERNGGNIDPTQQAGRFWSRVTIGTEDECWPWTGSRNQHGYGRLGKIYAHRLSWQFHYGPIPDGMIVMHACDVPPCVNPWHLRLGTQPENVADMIRKGRSRWAATGS